MVSLTMPNVSYITFIISLVLLIIGGLNWGLIAINSNWDLVKNLFPNTGTQEIIRRIIYGLVGIAAVLALLLSMTNFNDIFSLDNGSNPIQGGEIHVKLNE